MLLSLSKLLTSINLRRATLHITTMGSIDIPNTQTVALVRELGGTVEFKSDYPVPTPDRNEVLAKVLYSGVCQSGMFSFSSLSRES